MDAMARVSSVVSGEIDVVIPAVVAGEGRFSQAFLQAIDAAINFMPDKRPQTIAQWRVMLPQTGQQVADPDAATIQAPSLAELAVPEPPSVPETPSISEPAHPPSIQTHKPKRGWMGVVLVLCVIGMAIYGWTIRSSIFPTTNEDGVAQDLPVQIESEQRTQSDDDTPAQSQASVAELEAKLAEEQERQRIAEQTRLAAEEAAGQAQAELEEAARIAAEVQAQRAALRREIEGSTPGRGRTTAKRGRTTPDRGGGRQFGEGPGATQNRGRGETRS